MEAAGEDPAAEKASRQVPLSPEGEPVQTVENTVIAVIVNGKPVALTGKSAYVYVDVFSHIDFDLSKPQGSAVITMLNGREARYMEPLQNGDTVEIYWKK